MRRFLEQPRLTALILLSFVFSFAHSGPLNGSTIALVLVLIFQLYLPGYLLARLLGKLRVAQPILRVAWVLVCGLSLTIVLGGLARLFNLPIAAYLLILHGVMLFLVWMTKPDTTNPRMPWVWSWRKLPLFALLAACCLTLVGVNIASRYRFNGYEDVVIFSANVNWLAHNEGEIPLGRPLRTRLVGRIPRDSDTRHDTDGWTYDQAAWVWSSGVSASQVIWYDLDPFFLWTVPLVIFALAYSLTRSEAAAAWSAAGLVIAGLLTLDNIVHYPSYVTFGRFSVFQINTLRQMSLTLMLPLVLMVAFSYLRGFRKRDLLLLILAGTALAMLHPIQLMLFVLALGVTALLKWLAKPNWRRLRRLLWLLPVVLVLLILPFVQRLNRAGLGAANSRLSDEDLASAASMASGFIILPDFPVVGDTFIRNPQQVFYHPLIPLVLLLGLLYGLRWRKTLAAQYIFGVSALFLLLSFTPGLTELYNKIASSVGLLTTIFLLPVALVLGLSLDRGLRFLGRGSYPVWPVTALLLAIIGLLLFEPVPIPASARDQIQAFKSMQASRQWLPAHTALSQKLQEVIPPGPLSVVMAPSDTVNIVLEELPHTLVTGGRASGNPAHVGDDRFYNRAAAVAPWLDSEDLVYMQQWGVTHIINRIDYSRSAQLLLQPERFELLGQTDGQLIFALRGDLEADTIDDLYARMNALYAETAQPRWGPQGFALVRPGDDARWQALAQTWTDMLAQQPDNDRVRLGLAYTRLMRGEDDQVLPLWQTLHQKYPDIPFFADALAFSDQIEADARAGAGVLLAALDSPTPETRVMAARSLLSETFFYLLNDADLDRVLEVRRNDADTWDYLDFFDAPQLIRRQATLLMTAQRWEAVIDWLNQLTEIEVSPRDMTAQAAALLAQGKVDAALALLKNASDPDWRAAKAFWHPDRWQENHAARMYDLLSGDVAARDGRLDEAIQAYEAAIADGATLPGHYFLAQTLDANGDTARARQVRDQLSADWASDQPFPPLAPLLTIAASGDPFVMQLQVIQEEAALDLSASFGDFQPQQGYPLSFWRVEVISPDSSTHYAQVDVPPLLIDDALVRQTIHLDLPDNIPTLSPALVFVKAGASNAVTTTAASLHVTLARPPVATMPASAVPLQVAFGDAITLESYTLERELGQIALTLYWRTSDILTEDYQVFVHVLDQNGNFIAQDDSAPVQNRYPTSQWRTETLIADEHDLSVSLPAHFSIRVGLYRLSDNTRLTISPADERVQDNSLLIYEAAQPEPESSAVRRFQATLMSSGPEGPHLR